MNGNVVRMMSEKGFGFIRGEDNKDYFFHKVDFHGFFDDLVEDFLAGRKVAVTFMITPSDKGPRAGQVVRLDGGI
jgi:cold shock CspA family protein